MLGIIACAQCKPKASWPGPWLRRGMAEPADALYFAAFSVTTTRDFHARSTEWEACSLDHTAQHYELLNEWG